MKKFFSALMLVSLLTLLIVPQIVLAAEPSPVDVCKLHTSLDGWTTICPDVTPLPATTTVEGYPVCCLMSTIFRITDWLFIGLVSLVVIFVLLGGYNIITAGGDAAKVTTGRTYILWAAIGLVVALLAKAAPGIVRVISGLS